jgi:hypothetical protein
MRKEVDIPGYPVSGRMLFSTNPTHRFFVNSVLVPGMSGEQATPMTHYLKQGKNMLAVECPEAAYFSIGGAALIRYIPEYAMGKEN